MIKTESSLLLNERQAAQALSLSSRKLFSIRKKGGIAFVKSGRSVRYDKRDLLAWIDANKRLADPSLN